MQNNYINKFQRDTEVPGYGVPDQLTPEEIIQKLAEKKYEGREVIAIARPNVDVAPIKREAYKDALRDVLPLIDGWVSVQDRLPELDINSELTHVETYSEVHGIQILFYGQIFQNDAKFHFHDHNDIVYHGITHWKPLPASPGDYSSLQKLLEDGNI